MDQERIWLLAARKLSKEATPEELQELEELFRKYPDMQYAYLLINELKESTGEQHGANEAEMEGIREHGLRRWREENEDIYPWEQSSERRGYKAGKPLLLLAFCVLIAGSIVFTTTRKPEKDIAAVETPEIKPKVYNASETSSIVLQDGTKVWLNHGSTLHCSNKFGLRNREVYLQGEAFFDVASDAQKPFIVHAGDLVDIKVLGTQFNVKAYPGDPYVETALVSGKVAVNIKEDKKKEVILEPHQKITYYTQEENAGQAAPEQENTLQISEIKRNAVTHTLAETAWMEDKLAFNDITFGELAYDLERRYHKKIEFKDERIKAYHLTGEFKHEDINQILKALQITTPFHYTISENKIIITR